MSKLKPYDSYQRVQYDYVAELPDGWDLWKIAHAFRLIGSGTTPASGSKEYHSNGTINWINTGDLNDNYLSSCKNKITKLALSKYSTLKMYPKGTLLIAMYGATIGKTGILDIDACTNQACCALSNSKILLNRFTQYWFIANRKRIINLSYGGGQPNISQDVIKKLKLPVPPLDIQNAIVAYLDRKTQQIQTFIQKKERLIELLEEDKKSTIYKLITKGKNSYNLINSNNEWIGSIPEHWDVVKFNHYVFLRHGHQFRDYDFKNEGTKIVKITQLTYEGNLDLNNCSFIDSKRINEFKEDIIKKGDVLMALTGGTIGKIIRVNNMPEVLLQNYRVGNFFPSNKKLTKDYLFWLLSSSVIFDQILFGQRETGQPNIGKGDFGKMYIPLPPFNEQVEIVKEIETELSPLDKAISKAQSEIEKAKEYQESLITQVVTGQLKVPATYGANQGEA